VWVIVFIGEGLFAVTLPTHNLTSWIDSQIPVVPQFVWFYVLCYVFPLLPIAITHDWHRVNIALMSVALCTLIAFIGHLSIPVAFVRPDLGTGISDRMVRLIYENDFRPGAQNFPSLHVAIAWTIYFTCRGQSLSRLRENAILTLASFIIASTVLIKQHLVIDLVGGTVLGFAVWYGVKRFYLAHIRTGDDPLEALGRMAKDCLPTYLSVGVVLLGIAGYQLL
jgi:membrane-associated phospholipid phosphatase